MQDAMEADQDKPGLSRRGSFYVAEDSFLLSDYLHRQAEEAGNRFFNNINSLIFLRSTFFLSELEQKEEEENSDRCCPLELKSMPLGLSEAHKESSESFTGRECSSRILSELELEKGNSSLPQIILASSVSYLESSDCCESVEAATKIEANSKNFHSTWCNESRQSNSLSIDEEEEEDAENDEDEDGIAEEALTASLDTTDSLNLLVAAAMQVDNFDEDDACDRVVGPGSLKTCEGAHAASVVHGNRCPKIKRKVVRRAKSAFQKQNCHDRLHRLVLSKAATRAFEKKARHVSGTYMIDQISYRGFMDQTECRKLRDCSLNPSNALKAACTNVNEDLERNQCEQKKWPIGSFGDVREEISVVENTQVLPAKLPSSLSTEASKMANSQYGNHGYFVHHKRLQVLSGRLSDAFNAEHFKGLKMQGRQPTIRLKLENPQTPPSLNRNGWISKGLTGACATQKETRKSSMERLRSQEEEARLRIMQLDDTMRNGSSGLRLKILPIRLPSADLPSLQEVSKSKSTEVILEDQMVTRKRSCLSNGERDKATIASELMLHKEIPLHDTYVKDEDPMIRSKRGRSRVLPTKFSDSVLQPWKSSRKKCKSKF